MFDTIRYVKYHRIVMKLSGGAMSGEAGWGFDPKAINHIADEIMQLHHEEIQVAVMVGGGNIFKGELADTWRIERAEADNIGMMATVINSLLLRGVLQSRGDAEVRVMTAIPINTVAEPYIRLRAIRHLEHQIIVLLAAGTGNPYVTTDYPAVQRALELRADALLAAKNGIDGVYTSDPNKNPSARRYLSISYDKVIADNLKVLDHSAVLLARDHDLPIHVFDFDAPGVMFRICNGEEVGTRIGV
ncbi:MAG: UMP kinase [Omnitrophica WOR_2 bacterium]